MCFIFRSSVEQILTAKKICLNSQLIKLDQKDKPRRDWQMFKQDDLSRKVFGSNPRICPKFSCKKPASCFRRIHRTCVKCKLSRLVVHLANVLAPIISIIKVGSHFFEFSNLRKKEKRIISLIMNPQFYESVGESVLNLVVSPKFSESEILKSET